MLDSEDTNVWLNYAFYGEGARNPDCPLVLSNCGNRSDYCRLLTVDSPDACGVGDHPGKYYGMINSRVRY